MHARQSFDEKILNLCRPLVALNKWDEAVSLLEQVIARGSIHPEALRLLARGYRNQGRIHDELATLRAFCSAYPGSCDEAFELCRLLVGSDRQREALDLAVEQIYAARDKAECGRLLELVETLMQPDLPVVMPDFLGIGAQKAATSWLHSMLELHPDVFVPPCKEMHHFDSVLASRMDTYSHMFRSRNEQSKGEITPAYSALEETDVKRIHGYRSDLKILFVLRNPVERAWSHARMNLATQRGREPQDVPLEEYLEHFRSEASLRRGDYPSILDRWETYFGAGQMLVLFHEDIVRKPREVLSTVFHHLGLRDDLPGVSFPVDSRIHQGQSFDLPPEGRAVLEGLYAQSLKKLAARYGDRVSGWLPRK